MSKYAWVIMKDHLAPDGFGGEVGVKGPRDATPELLADLTHMGRTFEMRDDDGELYYTGRIVGEYDGFEPLDDFGRPNAGCTSIRYPGSGPEYGGGKDL